MLATGRRGHGNRVQRRTRPCDGFTAVQEQTGGAGDKRAGRGRHVDEITWGFAIGRLGRASLQRSGPAAAALFEVGREALRALAAALPRGRQLDGLLPPAQAGQQPAEQAAGRRGVLAAGWWRWWRAAALSLHDLIRVTGALYERLSLGQGAAVFNEGRETAVTRP
jgi:hypothetical protein